MAQNAELGWPGKSCLAPILTKGIGTRLPSKAPNQKPFFHNLQPRNARQCALAGVSEKDCVQDVRQSVTVVTQDLSDLMGVEIPISISC